MKQIIYLTLSSLAFILVLSNIGYFTYSGSARIGSAKSVQYQEHISQSNHAAPEQVAVYHFIGE